MIHDEFMKWLRGVEPLPLHAAVELTPERLAQMWLEEFHDRDRAEVIGWIRPDRLPQLMLEYAGALAELNPGHVVYDANRDDVRSTIAAIARSCVDGVYHDVDLSRLPAAIHWALTSVLSTSIRFRTRHARQAIDSAPSLLSAAAAQRPLLDYREDGRRTVLANIAIARVQRIFRDESVPTLEEILAANQRWSTTP